MDFISSKPGALSNAKLDEKGFLIPLILLPVHTVTIATKFINSKKIETSFSFPFSPIQYWISVNLEVESKIEFLTKLKDLFPCYCTGKRNFLTSSVLVLMQDGKVLLQNVISRSSGGKWNTLEYGSKNFKSTINKVPPEVSSILRTISSFSFSCRIAKYRWRICWPSFWFLFHFNFKLFRIECFSFHQ